MNATKHGERSAEAMNRRREWAEVFALLRGIGEEVDGTGDRADGAFDF